MKKPKPQIAKKNNKQRDIEEQKILKQERLALAKILDRWTNGKRKACERGEIS